MSPTCINRILKRSAAKVGLFFILVANGSPLSHAGCISDTLSRLIDRSGSERAFNYGQFQKLKSEYAENIKHGLRVDVPPQNPTEKLALLEAVYDSQGVTLRLDEDLAKRVRKLDFAKGLSELQSEDFLMAVYNTVHGDPLSFRKLRPSQWPTNKKEFLRKRITAEFMAKPIAMALRDLGLIRDPGAIEKIRMLARDLSPKQDAALYVALNAYSVVKAGLPGYLPDIKLLSPKKVPPEIREKIRNEGFDAAYEDLKRHLGSPADFDFYWSWSRKLYLSATLSVATGFAALETIKQIKQRLNASEKDQKELDELKRKVDTLVEPEAQPQPVDATQLESMKQLFRQQTGREPTANETKAMERILRKSSDTR